MKLKLNSAMKGYEAGRTITVQADSSGLPLDKFWRRRLRDAQTDNCVEVVEKTPKAKKLAGDK